MKDTLAYRGRARKGVNHTSDGVIYLHHFGTGWQELVFVDHAAAARFAAAHDIKKEGDHGEQGDARG